MTSIASALQAEMILNSLTWGFAPSFNAKGLQPFVTSVVNGRKLAMSWIVGDRIVLTLTIGTRINTDRTD